MPPIQAIVHTVGSQTVQGKYVPLEVAYQDCEGNQSHFLINCGEPASSLLSYAETSIDIDAATTRGVELKFVQKFLNRRFRDLSKKFGSRNVTFGCKGRGLQPAFLVDAGIGNIANVDFIGVKPLSTLDPDYHTKGGGDVCTHHVNNSGKCALRAVQLMAPLVFNRGQEKWTQESPEINVNTNNFNFQMAVKDIEMAVKDVKMTVSDMKMVSNDMQMSAKKMKESTKEAVKECCEILKVAKLSTISSDDPPKEQTTNNKMIPQDSTANSNPESLNDDHSESDNWDSESDSHESESDDRAMNSLIEHCKLRGPIYKNEQREKNYCACNPRK